MDEDIIEEIVNRRILHWNYRNLTELPVELFHYGLHIEEIYFKSNKLVTLVSIRLNRTQRDGLRY
jgi:hypothetical protein